MSEELNAEIAKLDTEAEVVVEETPEVEEVVVEPEKEETVAEEVPETPTKPVADPPEVVEKSEEFYQAKYQKAKEENQQLVEELDQFKDYVAPVAPEPVKVPNPDEDYRDESARTKDDMRQVYREEKLRDNQEANNRTYALELKAVKKTEASLLKGITIPDDVLKEARDKALQIIPRGANGSDYAVGDASRRLEVQMMYLAPHTVANAKSVLDKEIVADDAKKTAQLEKISQPAGGGSSPVVGTEMTANDQESQSIAPFDPEPT